MKQKAPPPGGAFSWEGKMIYPYFERGPGQNYLDEIEKKQSARLKEILAKEKNGELSASERKEKQSLQESLANMSLRYTLFS